MVEALKMAVRVGVIVGVAILISGVLIGITVPTSAVYEFGAAIGKGLAIAEYWFPMFKTWATVGGALLGVEVAVITAEVALIAVKWVLLVNEG